MPELHQQTVISPVLVGRAQELFTFHQLIDQAKRARGQIMLLAGEAGVGKSRLLREMKTDAASQGFFVQPIACFQADRAIPNAPLFEMVQSYLLSNSAPVYPADLTAILHELSFFFPEFVSGQPEQNAVPLDPEQRKHRFFVLLASFFLRLAAQQPILIMVEDVHWSDASTLEFLHYLMRRSLTQPMLLLLTYRSDEISLEFKQWLAQLDREHQVQELRLAPLSRDEVGRMLRAIFALNHSSHPAFLDAIYDLTEGNPFFIEEVLKSLMVSGAVALKDGNWELRPISAVDIPRSVEAAVQQRSEQLSEEARKVVRLAAVMGRRFDFALLRQLTQYSESQLLVLMKELVAAQLIVEESADRFGFRHALTRQALYSSLLARERRSLHLTIAQALETVDMTPLDRRAADLAYHFYEAGSWEQSLSYSMQAGEHALSLYALRPAVEHFTRALAASQHLGHPVPTALYRSRGQTYEMLGEFKLALADLELALQQAQIDLDQPAEWQALLDLGLLWSGQDYAQAGKYYQRAFELAQAMNQPLVLANSLNRLGNWHLNVEHPLESHWYHQEALAIFRDLNDQTGIASTLDLLGMASYLSGDLVQGTQYYRQAIERFRQLDQRQGLVSSLASLTMRTPTFQIDTLVPAASFKEGTQDGEQALALAREMGHRSGEAYALIFLGMCVGSQGDYRRAFNLLQNALTLAEEIDHRQWMTAAQVALGALYAEALAFPVSEQQLQSALTRASEIQSLHWLRHAAAFLTMTRVQQGKLAEAEALLEQYLDPEAAIRTIGQRVLWRARVEWSLARGEGNVALDAVDRLLASAANLSTVRSIPRLFYLRGEALRLLNQDDAAEAEWRRALDVAEEQKASPLVWRIHAALARLYQARSRHDEAAREASAAQALIDPLAAELPEGMREGFSQQVLSYLPASSVQISTRPSRDDLTPREREIAVLIAQGKSNRQMAEQLVLSERTIETHVRNILSKLGLTSRTQVALWAVEVGLIHSP